MFEKKANFILIATQIYSETLPVFVSSSKTVKKTYLRYETNCYIFHSILQ